MRIVCLCCGKQALDADVSANDEYTTTLKGARAGFKAGECYCGHCAKDMDENGLFPEERAQLNGGSLTRRKPSRQLSNPRRVRRNPPSPNTFATPLRTQCSPLPSGNPGRSGS